MSPALPCLVGRWVHSREEAIESTRIYRPSGWSLPLSRLPRHVLEFEPDRRLVSHLGGPADVRIAAKAGGTSSQGNRSCCKSSGETHHNLLWSR